MGIGKVWLVTAAVVCAGVLGCAPCDGQLDCLEKGEKLEVEQGRSAAAPLYLRSCTTGDWDAEAGIRACRKYSWAVRSPTGATSGPSLDFKVADRTAWKAVSERLRSACLKRKPDACESVLGHGAAESLATRNEPDPDAAKKAARDEWCPFAQSLCTAEGPSSVVCRTAKMGFGCS
jgi:hypothetical protein